MTDKKLREAAAALGPPIYGIRGRRIRTNSYTGDERSFLLAFGRFDNCIEIETTTEPIDEDRMLLNLVIPLEPHYPFSINEYGFELVLDELQVGFSGFIIDENWWCGTARIAERWVFIRSINSVRTGISLRKMSL